jgi:hypothetical protein
LLLTSWQTLIRSRIPLCCGWRLCRDLFRIYVIVAL